jgi:hypothetical protein
MTIKKHGIVIETPTEARQVEPGPSVLALLTISTCLAVLILAASGLRSFEPERPYGFRWMCASTLLHSVGIFVIRKFFISAAMRNCPAFLMASVRFDPCGNFLAFARASDALASQS